MGEEIDEGNEIKNELRNRLRSKFYGSWAISFVAWNWRAVLYLIYPEADWKVRDRILWLGTYAYKEFWWVQLILMPIVTAAIAVAVLPWLTDWLEDIRHKASIVQKNRRIEQEARLIPVAKQIQDLNLAMAELKKKIEEKDSEISSMKADRVSLVARVLANNEQLKLNFQTLAKGAPVGISSGAKEMIQYGVMKATGNGLHVITEFGLQLAKLSPNPLLGTK